MQATKIYIIEDSFLTALHLSKLLEGEGYCITGISNNGEEALEAIRELLPDMVLIDIGLTGEMKGIETAALLKKQFNIPHIFITPSTDKTTFQKAKQTEPYGYVNNPFNECEVVTVIELGVYKSVQEKKIKHHVEQVLQEKELAIVSKQLADLRLHTLYSAMNPHFIFNALNAIQFFIIQHDRINAISYLSTFSKLIRDILKYSDKGTISLKSEIEFLQHYVKLEQLRFGDKFDFTIQVDTPVNLKYISIPSLLILPFMENAILYSLSQKKNKGLLALTITVEVENVCLTIEDDGIGQSGGYILKEKLPEVNNSLLTIERIRTMVCNHKIDIQVSDRNSTHKENPGTLVRITIPFETINKL